MRSLIFSAVAAVALVFAGNAAQAERLTEKPLVDATWRPYTGVGLCALWQVWLARKDG